MTLPGETVGKSITAINCTECGKVLYLEVCRSNAGYYLGYKCSKCGPFSRESGYYPTGQDAFDAGIRGDYGR